MNFITLLLSPMPPASCSQLFFNENAPTDLLNNPDYARNYKFSQWTRNSNKSIQLGKQRVNCEYDLHFLKFWLSWPTLILLYLVRRCSCTTYRPWWTWRGSSISPAVRWTTSMHPFLQNIESGSDKLQNIQCTIV